MVLSGGQTMLMMSSNDELLFVDRAKRTITPVPEGGGRLIGGNEVMQRDGGSRDLRTNTVRAITCDDPLRRLPDGSLLCRTWQGYRRIWPDRERSCGPDGVGASLIWGRDDLWPRVLLLAEPADPQCLEVFDGLIDWIP